MRTAFWIIAAVALAVLAYVRFAPADPARWHQSISSGEDMDMANGAVRVMPAGDGTFARLNEIALATPLTKLVARSVEERRVTFETRSPVFGFPDYTTAEVRDGTLRVFARSRFGRGDFGVNRARVEAWLAQL